MGLENQITFYLLLIILRPLTVIIHELGHGIPALFLTKDKVTLYIGSYGDPNKGFHFRLGRLECFFKYNPVLWKLGLCVPHAKTVSIVDNIIITLFGPLTSLIIGATALYFSLWGAYDQDVNFLMSVIAISTLYDFLINIIPREDPIVLYDGTSTHNDGQQLKLLWQYRNLPKSYDESVNYYNNGEFKKAAELFKKVLDSGGKRDFIYRLAITSYLQFKAYDKAAIIQEEFFNKHKKKFNSNDYFSAGVIKSHQDSLEASLQDYNESLRLNPDNVYSLNNRGYTYNLLGEYEKAKNDFNKAIALEENFAYALNNRGLSKIRLGDFKGGFEDIQSSFKLDDSNSYCFMNLGIYYYEIAAYQDAMEAFNKALALDEDTYLLKGHIKKLKEKMDT